MGERRRVARPTQDEIDRASAKELQELFLIEVVLDYEENEGRTNEMHSLTLRNLIRERDQLLGGSDG